jgi:hypothetical protein
VVRDESDVDTFDDNVDAESHIEEYDEAAISESDEKTCNLELTQLPIDVAQLRHVGNQSCIGCMSRANEIDVTRKGLILEISFGQIYFLIFLKNS